MHLSIMNATFPCMKQFLNAFNTELGATINIKVPADRPGSQLRTMNSNSDAVYQLGQMGGLMPDVATSKTLVKASRSRRDGLDQCSVESDHSNAAIIRKRQSWEIRYETCE